jgi:ADP-ribose pyrophosphatase YjhB (NUDIX family)
MKTEQILSKKGSKNICPMAVFIKERQILLGLRHYLEKSIWTYPGGRCEEEETIEQTLRREVLEEIGVNNFSIINYLGEVKGISGKDKVPIFICESSETIQNMEPKKFSKWKWFNINDIPKNHGNLEIIRIIIGHLNPK